MCCLRYEHEFYVTTRRRFPKEGKAIRTAKGEERVIANDLFRERVTLRAEEGEARTVTLEELRAELEGLGLPFPTPVGPPPKPQAQSPVDREEDDEEGEEEIVELMAVSEPDDAGAPEQTSASETNAAPGNERRRGRRRGRRGGRRGRHGPEGGNPGNSGPAPQSPPPPPAPNS
jgi:hypothetical protein